MGHRQHDLDRGVHAHPRTHELRSKQGRLRGNQGRPCGPVARREASNSRRGITTAEERAVSRRWTLLASSRALADLLAIHVGFGLSYWLYDSLIGAKAFEGPVPSAAYAGVLVLYAAICLLVFWQLGLYQERASVLNLGELRTAVKGVALGAAFLFGLLFFLKLGPYSRLAVVGGISISLLLILLERRILSAIVAHRQRGGRYGRSALIFGSGETGRLLMKKIVQAPHLGLRVVGFLDDFKPIGSVVSCRATQTEPEYFRAPVLGRLEDLDRLVAEHEADELLVAAALFSPERLRQILDACRSVDVRVGVVPALGDMRADQLAVEDLSAIPVLRGRHSPTQRLYPIAKRSFDLLGALCLLIVGAPAWLAAALAIRLETPGPALFQHDRVGERGRRFRMYKFRTMQREVEPYAPSPPEDIDPGITRVGRVLRCIGIDELPQLINVLKGDMSLVGPRPEMPFIVESYTPFQRQRLETKPGITGLWQVSADRHGEIHDNIEYDLYYIAHQSFLLDLLILFETCFFTVGLMGKGLVGLLAPSGRAPRAVVATETAPPRPYILVALDQRNGGAAPRNWETWLPPVHALGNRWPVRVLAAQENVLDFDSLLARSEDGGAESGARVDYVPYRSRSELRALTMNAGFVLTDLTHVEKWAREANVDVATVRHGEVFPSVRSPRGYRILADLIDCGRQVGSLTVRTVGTGI
ncbi:MAG: sugar transferase [Gemmatimonadota bacterium]